MSRLALLCVAVPAALCLPLIFFGWPMLAFLVAVVVTSYVLALLLLSTARHRPRNYRPHRWRGKQPF